MRKPLVAIALALGVATLVVAGTVLAHSGVRPDLGGPIEVGSAPEGTAAPGSTPSSTPTPGTTANPTSPPTPMAEPSTDPSTGPSPGATPVDPPGTAHRRR